MIIAAPFPAQPLAETSQGERKAAALDRLGLKHDRRHALDDCNDRAVSPCRR